MLIRGHIQDRPWGMTLGAFARRAVTGRLAIAELELEIVFARGHVIGSRGPVGASEDPTARRLETIALVASTFALEHGEFTFEEGITHTVIPHGPIHVGGLIHLGAKNDLSPTRLVSAVQALGNRFALRSGGSDDLAYYGFGELEYAIVLALGTGLTTLDLDAMPAANRPTAYAAIYTLACLDCVTFEVTRAARGTQSHQRPEMRTPRASQPPPVASPAPAIQPLQAAAIAFRRGQAALRDERFDDAVHELEHATELLPQDADYRSTLAWARFCTASDKQAVAAETRTTLKQAALRSNRPVLPNYYLGLVERILGRTAQAAEYFERVVELDPAHNEAHTELRFLNRLSRR